MKYAIPICFAVLLGVSFGYGEMVRWVDERGTVHFADDLSHVPERYRSAAESRETPKGTAASGRATEDVRPATPSPARSEEIEIPLYRRHELWLAEVVLNGRAKRQFILDSGASFTLINRQTANELGLVVDENTPFIPVSTVSGVIMTPLVTLRSIQVGKAELENVEALIYSMPSGGDGLLGNSFLNKFKIVIDTSNQKLILSEVQGQPSPDRPGGLGMDYWVGQFRFYNRNLNELKNLRARMETKSGQSDLGRVNNAIRYFENQLAELERRASNAGVPRSWRE